MNIPAPKQEKRLIDCGPLLMALEIKQRSFLGTMSEGYRNGYLRALEDMAVIIDKQPTYRPPKDRAGLTNKQVLRQMSTRELADFLNEPTCDHCARRSRCGKKDMRNCITGISTWLNWAYNPEGGG